MCDAYLAKVVGIVIGFLLGFRTEAASNRHHQVLLALCTTGTTSIQKYISFDLLTVVI